MRTAVVWSVVVVGSATLAGCGDEARPVVGGGSGNAVHAGEVPGVHPGDVLARSWPARVTPTGPWSASAEGTGSRVTLTTGGTVVGGLGRSTVDLGRVTPDRPTSGRALALPDGERWYPQAPFTLQAEGDVAFATVASGPATDTGGAYAAVATEREVVVQVGFAEILGAAAAGGGGQVVARGEFLGSDGARVDELVLPAATTVAPACADPAATTSVPTATCAVDPEADGVVVTVEAVKGTVVRSSGDGEAAVAGTGRAEALGRSWDGLVVAVEGDRLDATATYDGNRWTLDATVDRARQVWVDVWPVADTVLDARSFSTDPGLFDRNRLLRVEWANVGHATSQILGAEGVGPGAPSVGFALNKTLGHDVGVGARRGDDVTNLKGGGDVDSNLRPGGETDRELSYRQGQPATVVLRGNFAEVRIDLAVPGA